MTKLGVCAGLKSQSVQGGGIGWGLRKGKQESRIMCIQRQKFMPVILAPERQRQHCLVNLKLDLATE